MIASGVFTPNGFPFFCVYLVDYEENYLSVALLTGVKRFV